ncbi:MULTISPECIES: SDR family NAD(P)-dependent oxidoreductase [unclassified Rhizobium]|uniref:SDR family NAD(P)-dependent oxidoreductase n=1 Tax=unclassified Rhizobium TaxID=2613769 RepID=UPI001ADA3773|nr:MULTISPECIES: SDR family oxidoreductase [unclassified Rhizobium]MBO9123762.1 SDR family oxidoreductase [Rhizobium sp. 16-488-2b]MBO9174294.1 SDR family oxidoreductase [Rhizobium sp. 16-488-2a]
MPLLENNVAVVTGAATGLGQAIAAGFAREGANVVLLDIDGEGAFRAAAEIRSNGDFASAYQLDVTDNEACHEVAARIAKEVGQVSILVNNAGINRFNAFTADPQDVRKDWQDIMAINLNGVFQVTQAFLPPLRATKGRIINMGSIKSFVHATTPASVAYTSSKHAVLGLTKGLAVELAKDGIRVNAIGPGIITTKLNEELRTSSGWQHMIDHTPLGRPGTTDDVVGPAIFLASDMSAYVNGTILMVDGGFTTV